ncbi:LOW QUALITY PROTEIN: hypothetical protein JCM19038_1054 [Geomicrobium sp. JCM 19038]|nr:LOW QUALITY PROTEIN: hypothetical protein JCM19038_1054 [Geomicrobium sp. JCM 19038]
MLLRANHLSYSVKGKSLFSIEQLHVYEGERIGLVGKNGVGKTTLLQLLANMKSVDQGEVILKGTSAFVPQEDDLPSLEAEHKERHLWNVPQTPNSGGEKTRLKIAHAFATEAELLIMDEPTSHLDVTGIEQLEEQIVNETRTVIITSHDIAFLNNICTTIWELDDGKLTAFTGNYDAYKKQKRERIDEQAFQYDQYVKEKKRLQQSIEGVKKKSASVKKAPSRMGNSEARLHKRSAGETKAKLNRAGKAIDSRIQQLEVKEKPKTEAALVFNAAQFTPLNAKYVVQFQDQQLIIPNQNVAKKLSGHVQRGERLAIIGENGIGKTTLLRNMYKDRARFSVSKAANIGYFDQHQEQVDGDRTILENALDHSPYEESFVRTVLARLQFRGDVVHQRAAYLSGGERVKLSLIMTLLGEHNVLFLDEPTNYLDYAAKEALIELLIAFPGTIVFVTHDRQFIDEVASHTLDLSKDEAGKMCITKLHKSRQWTTMQLDLQITETLSRLATTVDEEEKALLDQKFQELMNQKNRLK